METLNRKHKVTEIARKVTATALIAGFVLAPATGSAGLLDKAKSRVQQATGKVTELKNNVQAKVENVKDKIKEMDGENLEQFMETVHSMFQYVKQAQADYKGFVGTDKCGATSPCSAFRAELRKMIESFIKLPQELPFVENVPPAVRRLEKMANLVDLMPPPILYASEKVLGNAFDELQYRLDLVRYAASQIPQFPTMAELSHASATPTVSSAPTVSSDKTRKGKNKSSSNQPNPPSSNLSPSVPEFPYCTALLDTGKVHVELLTKSLEHVGDFLWDLADMMEENKTVGANILGEGVTLSVDNPAKGTTQRVGFVIKAIRQVVEIKVAATASICALKGYEAP